MYIYLCYLTKSLIGLEQCPCKSETLESQPAIQSDAPYQYQSFSFVKLCVDIAIQKIKDEQKIVQDALAMDSWTSDEYLMMFGMTLSKSLNENEINSLKHGFPQFSVEHFITYIPRIFKMADIYSQYESL